MISSPRRSPKQPLAGIELHDPLHDRKACPEFYSFHQGIGQISPREGLISCRLLPKRGQICDIPDPPQSLNDSKVYSTRYHNLDRGVIKSFPLGITYINADNSPVHVTVLLSDLNIPSGL